MYSSLQLLVKYISFFLRASNSKGHGIHSPFVFEFITQILNDKTTYPEFEKIEFIRKKLLKDHSKIHFEDMGAGSASGGSSERKISSITKYSAKSPKLAQLLFRIAKFYQPENIVELGTSFGITTCYLAAAMPGSKVYTLEGAASVARYAQRNFDQLSLKNIELIGGNIDNTLAPLLRGIPRADMAFVDANHRYEPATRYFNLLLEKAGNESVFIFDDIHWSPEMQEAWDKIKNNEAVTVSIDLFFIGLLFFRQEMRQKQHFVIRS